MNNIYFYLFFGIFLYLLFTRVLENYNLEQENFDPSLVPVSSIVTLAKVAQKLVNGNGTLTNPGNLQIGASTSTPGNLTVTGNTIVNGTISSNQFNDSSSNPRIQLFTDGISYYNSGSGNLHHFRGNLGNNTGDVLIDRKLDVRGATTSTGLVTANGGATVNGGATINGGATVSGGATVNGVLTVNGPSTKNITFTGSGSGQNLNSYISTPSLNLGRGWNNGDIIHSNAPAGLSLTSDNGVTTLGNFGVTGNLTVNGLIPKGHTYVTSFGYNTAVPKNTYRNMWSSSGLVRDVKYLVRAEISHYRVGSGPDGVYISFDNPEGIDIPFAAGYQGLVLDTGGLDIKNGKSGTIANNSCALAIINGPNISLTITSKTDDNFYYNVMIIAQPCNSF